MVADEFGGETGMDLILGLDCDPQALSDVRDDSDDALRAAAMGYARG
jgi:hypothetical protein